MYRLTTNGRLLGGVTLALVLLGGGPATARNIYVSTCGDDGWTGSGSFCLPPNGPKRTIQAAIGVAFDGDEIRVTAGTYYETIDFNGKAVRLLGLTGPELTTIDGNGSGPVVLCANGEGPDTIVEGFTITGGHASGSSGGGMVCYGTSPTIDDCVFEGNSADDSGGGLLNLAGSPVLQAVKFIENDANNSGGGMLCFGGSPTINACRFENNHATDGAALALADDATPSITWTWFVSNDAFPGQGGATYNDESSPYFGLCSFVGNTAWAGGGAVSGVYGNATYEGVVFQANEATNGSAGALYNGGGTSMFSSCSFESNYARAYGGATRHTAGTARYTDCTFNGNTAGLGGGAIWSATGTLLVSGADFTDNSTDGIGGAIRTQWGYSTIANSRFVDCSAVIGGAIAATETGNVTIVNSLLRGNSAEAGGAIFDAGGGHDTRIVNCTVVENTAPEGGALIADGQTQVFNSIMWDNGNDAIAGFAIPAIRYSAVEGGWPGTGNLAGDPEFIDPGLANYRLGVTSPCQDAGVNQAVPADRLDLDGDGNEVERTPLDLDGQPRFMDAAADDSGCGSDVLVDIGAYEVAGAIAGDVIIGDINGDGVVEFNDLLQILDNWGPCGGCCPADLNLDGVVDFNDLLVVLTAWE